ncbi:Lactose permease [Pseudocercospora fuligena]|uniref:Lactose permease n=1 Tax=Pseudocercospora fuligena TaxID=685502 RepID=A0A8H6VQ06_9PEZI|nr:Lactose permease [Pseudocercospora fuligena]
MLDRTLQSPLMLLKFNVLWYVGSIVSAWLCFGTGHLSSNWSWRIPSLVQALPALLQMVAVIFMPESPRYLFSRGRRDEAEAILTRYHANGVRDDQLVAYEMTSISEALTQEASHMQKSWGEVLKPKANRKRFGICVAVALLTLWNGQGVISYYFSPILSSIGITSTTQQTGINGGMQIWNLICSLVGAYLAESIGRRPLWLASFIGMICANVPLTISSARYAKNGSNAAAYTTVVFLFLYNAAFNIACNPLLYAYTTEILPYGIRTKGLAVQIAVSEAALTVNQYVNPIALDSIGFWYFVFYLAMLVIGTLVIYFWFPETKGYTLEQLACLFEDEPTSLLPVLEAVDIEAESPIESSKKAPEMKVVGTD